MSEDKPKKSAGLVDIFKYAVGDGAISITFNGMASFGMIYLTQILGLSPSWASLAISIAILWDAVTDPVMGHISDNTRSRWGRRHQYVLVGGLLAAACFFMFWSVPQTLTHPVAIFASVLVINLMIRTATTVFMVPYTALGFEMCPEYESRSRLQGVRGFMNQTTNLIFVAFAWVFFFQDRIGADGKRIDGSLIASNYLRLGSVLAILIAALILICSLGSRRYAVDNRQEAAGNHSLKAFWKDFSSIFNDRLAVRVFVFFIVAQFAMMLMAQVQMFAYIFYMKFSAVEKTCVHGSGMLAFALASLGLSRMVKRFDKKQAGYFGIGLAAAGGLGLLAVFTGGLLEPGQQVRIFGIALPVATLVFGLLQACWWGGCGMVVPLASSMVADVAAINHKKTGLLKNASYASVFSFSTKAAGSIGIVICGWLVQWAGILSGVPEQTPAAVRNIAIMTFVAGPVVIFCALFILRKYPVTRELMENLD